MRRQWREYALIGGLAVVIGALIAYTMVLIERTRNPELEPKPLSYSRHRYGAKGFARLLEANGYTVRSFKRTFAHLPDDADMLIIFPPPFSPSEMRSTVLWTEEDRESLEAWVESGGRLILMSGDERIPSAFGGGIGRRLPPFAVSPPRFRNLKPLWHPKWLQEIKEVRMGEPFRPLDPLDSAWVPLLGDGGKVWVALYPYGDGYVLECADWSWLTNEHLRSADNGAFILAVVRWMLPEGGVIYFDDAGQGDLILDSEELPRVGFWAYAPTALRVAFLHLTILVAVVMISLGRRFGLPLPSKHRAPALGDYVEALANLYASSKSAQPALEAVIDAERRKLCRRLGLPAGSTLLQVIQSLPAESPLRAALMEAHQALQKPNLSEAEALESVRKIS